MLSHFSALFSPSFDAHFAPLTDTMLARPLAACDLATRLSYALLCSSDVDALNKSLTGGGSAWGAADRPSRKVDSPSSSLAPLPDWYSAMAEACQRAGQPTVGKGSSIVAITDVLKQSRSCDPVSCFPFAAITKVEVCEFREVAKRLHR